MQDVASDRLGFIREAADVSMDTRENEEEKPTSCAPQWFCTAPSQGCIALLGLACIFASIRQYE